MKYGILDDKEGISYTQFEFIVIVQFTVLVFVNRASIFFCGTVLS